MTGNELWESCAFCGLPLTRPWWPSRRQRPAPAGPHFCCYGCELAHSAASAEAPTGASRALLVTLGVAIFLTMNVMVFSMELWTQDVYGDAVRSAGDWLAEPWRDAMRYLCMLLSLPVLWLLGRPLAACAWQNLWRRSASTDLLIVAGVTAAAVYSMISVFRENGHIYFEVACTVLVMVTLGRWLDATGKLQTTAALDALEKLLPDTVCCQRAGRESIVPVAEVRPGDLIRVLAGERFALDGQLLAGQGEVDEQLVSGESRPVVKTPGDSVRAGTVNLDGDMLVRVTAELRAGTLQRIIDLVRQARLARGYHQQFVDSVSAWFIPCVAVVAVVTFAVHAHLYGFERGLLAGLAVALIACPCALGLATPMAVWAALGQASQAQVLIRSGEVLERLATVRAIAVDKTGTLTTGIPRVVDVVVPADDRPSDMLRAASTLASASHHPLSCAIRKFAVERGVSPDDHPFDVRVRTLPGCGLAADLPGHTTAYLGNLRLAHQAGLTLDGSLKQACDAAAARAQPMVCLGWDGKVRALFLFEEALRPEAKAAVDRCLATGLHVCVLTGDHATGAFAIGASLGLEVQSDLLPEEKVLALRRLRDRWGPVAMIGDGINDAPALAASDIGVAMGCGADVSRQSASVCLLGDQLARVPWTIELARQTVRVIRQNLFWAFFYNVGGVSLACLGLLNPIWASTAMVISSLMVIGNSLRLRGPVPEAAAVREANDETRRTVQEDRATLETPSAATFMYSDDAEAQLQQEHLA